MKKSKGFFLVILFLNTEIIKAQNLSDSTKKATTSKNADDPSQFISRIEVYNELQYYDKKDFYLNQTVIRSVIKIGKRFTTRIDLPYVYNSFSSPAKDKQSGVGDISFRLLGYNFMETRRAAVTGSIEVSLNTAASPLLGTGKNVLIPMISYSQVLPKHKLLLSAVLQQVMSVSGEKGRTDINFSKLQLICIRYFSKKTWMVLAPEWFLDYENGGLSMNLRTRFTYAVTKRMNIWVTPSAGIFGDFAGRYQWSADTGIRYFLFKAHLPNS